MNPSVKLEEEVFDIIQAPKGVDKSELPEILEVDKPFVVKGTTFILVKVEDNQFMTCHKIEGENKTSCSRKAKNYYIIKRV